MAKARPSIHSNGATPQPTPASEWRLGREGVIATLYSGLRVRLRTVDLSTLVMEGQIPDFLTALIIDMFENGTDAPGYHEPDKYPDPVHRFFRMDRKFMPLVNYVCRVAFVSPRIVDEPVADDEISIDDVPYTERLQVFNSVTRGLAGLHSFRDQSQADVDALPEGEDARPEAQPVNLSAS